MSAGTDMSAKDADTTLDNAAHGGCPAATCSASSSPRWRFHRIRNTNGWIGIVDTHHEDAGHIAGWVRPEDSELALAALNHFQPNETSAATGSKREDHE